MNYKNIIKLIIILLSFWACTNQQSNFGIEKDVVISGSISNYDDNKSPKTIQLVRRDFFEQNEKFVETINEDGTFKFKFPISYTQETWIIFGNFISVLCIPGDSCGIQIDNKLLNAKSKSDLISFSDSETGRTNSLINKFNSEKPNEEYIYNNSVESEKNLEPLEFKDYIANRERKYKAYLQKFKNENTTTELFDIWASENLKYESWNDLMRYRWTHLHYNNMKSDSFNIPENYFSFLSDYNMNDNSLFSIAHTDFLHELSMYSSEIPKDSLKNFREIIKTQDHKRIFDYLFSIIRLNSSGFTKDLFITESYMGLLKGQELDLFEAIYDPSYINDEYFINTINNEHQKLKNYLSNQNTANANLSTFKSSIVTGLLDSISQKYQNKVIYVDFWAPWCGPCMVEMPYSKELQQYFTDEDVVFLFLANRCNEDSWKATIANKKLSGEHILLTDDQFNVLAGLLSITGIPHYTLIDKKGNIVSKDAPRPSDKDKLITEIKRQIIK